MKASHVRHFSRLKAEDPALLSVLSREAATSAARAAKPRKAPGSPRHMSNQQWTQTVDKARAIANRIVTDMELEGSLPSNPIAREAMRAAFEMLSSGLPTKDRIAVVRTLLEYNLARPATAQNITVRTAEDYLDELAAHEAREEDL